MVMKLSYATRFLFISVCVLLHMMVSFQIYCFLFSFPKARPSFPAIYTISALRTILF